MIYLTHYLVDLMPFLQRPDVTDIYINKPHELWVETLGGSPAIHRWVDRRWRPSPVGTTEAAATQTPRAGGISFVPTGLPTSRLLAQR